MIEADNRLPKISLSISSLTVFKPRQVLLAEQQQQKSRPGLRMVKKQDEHLDHKAALIHSILSYLQKNGFSKTLKRFLKEAQIKDDNWKTSSDLEDVYSRYLENSRDVDKIPKAHMEQDVRLEKSSGDFSENASSKKKKKDKKKLENGKDDGEGGVEETAIPKDKKEKQKSRTVSSVEEGQETKKESNTIDTQAEDCKTESKMKKKKKEVSTKSSDNGPDKVDRGESLDASENGAKKELKKRKKTNSDEKEKTKTSSDNGREMVDQGESLKASENGAKKSKKRKLSASGENENKSMENSATGESKRRKTEDREEARVGKQQDKLNAEGIGHVDQKEPQTLSDKEVDGSKKGNLMENGILNSAKQKSAGKQKNGSDQQKTAANAFQRVKVDEVNYADERLQNNSYWAKDGAEYGYGAKAQEVLGQVKGRDFRHEKTKKKRGSYRGGQIDFQSHSIKFNYDEEE